MIAPAPGNATPREATTVDEPTFRSEITDAFDHVEGAHRVIARGDIDIATAPLLAQEFDRLIEAGAILVVLDAGDVTFVDSSGIRAIVDAGNRLRERGGRLLIEHVSAAMERILEVAGLIDHYRTGA
jgi:anti-sigma B factor antagonist